GGTKVPRIQPRRGDCFSFKFSRNRISKLRLRPSAASQQKQNPPCHLAGGIREHLRFPVSQLTLSPDRVGLAYSSPRNSKTNSKQAPSIRHGCTKALKDTIRPTVRLASAKPDCRGTHTFAGCPILARSLR